MEQTNIKPIKHILVCTNLRTDGKSCCVNVNGQEIYDELKKFVKEMGLRSVIWVTRTGCLGFCNDTGATVVIYPDQLWYKEVKKDDVQKIKDFILDATKKHF